MPYVNFYEKIKFGKYASNTAMNAFKNSDAAVIIVHSEDDNTVQKRFGYDIYYEKYKEQIDIRIGFEVEYLPKYFNKMYNQCVEMGAEYFLLGQHFVGNEEPWGHWIGQYVRPKEDLTEYVDLAVEAMKTGKFTYFCHPDVIDATDDMDFYIKENTRLCEAAKEYGVPLEINFYGIRDNRFYPYDKFWEIAGRVGCKVVYGFDSHDVEAAFDRASIPAADELVRKYGLKSQGLTTLIFVKLY